MSLRDKITNYIVGSEKKEPFNESKLPSSRRKQFLDILKNRFGALVSLSLLTFLFALPAIAWFIVWTAFIKSPPEDMVNDAVLMASRNFNLNIVLYLVLLPLLMVAYLGLSGTFHVLKKLCWNEGIFIWHDFFKGIKENWKVSLLSGFLVGFVLLGTMGNYYFYQTIELPFVIQVILMIIFTFITICTVVASFFMITQSQIFANSIGGYVKNAYLFATILFPKNLLIFLISVVPLVIYFLVRVIFVQLVYIFALAIIGFGIFALVWSLYSIYVFDKFINNNYEHEIVNKGLSSHKKGE